MPGAISDGLRPVREKEAYAIITRRYIERGMDPTDLDLSRICSCAMHKREKGTASTPEIEQMADFRIYGIKPCP